MNRIYWLEQKEGELRASEDWLSTSERLRLEALRFPKRRMDWLLGRWTAKRAVAWRLRLDDDPATLRKVQLLPGADGAPVVLFGDKAAGVSVSLSHRAGSALCVIAPSGIALGCDLELMEPHSSRFLSDYFTDEEQILVRATSKGARERMPSVLWSAKESVLKLLHSGLRLDTRTLSVKLTMLDEAVEQGEWQPFAAQFQTGAIFHGWWQSSDAFIRTAASFPPSAEPRQIGPSPVDARHTQNLPYGKISAEHACQV